MSVGSHPVARKSPTDRVVADFSIVTKWVFRDSKESLPRALSFTLQIGGAIVLNALLYRSSNRAAPGCAKKRRQPWVGSFRAIDCSWVDTDRKHDC